jgi:hypothetical protein
MVQGLLFETTVLSIYFSIATVTFRVALIRQSFHAVFSSHKNMLLESALPSDRKCD